MREQISGTANKPITIRLNRAEPGSIFISIVTVSEMMKGILNFLQRMAKIGRGVAGFDEMERFYKAWEIFPITPYTDVAHTLFGSFPPVVRRVGRPDCQIAAIAIANGYVVVTRNTRHFAQISGVIQEDWTRTDDQ